VDRELADLERRVASGELEALSELHAARLRVGRCPRCGSAEKVAQFPQGAGFASDFFADAIKQLEDMGRPLKELVLCQQCQIKTCLLGVAGFPVAFGAMSKLFTQAGLLKPEEPEEPKDESRG